MFPPIARETLGGTWRPARIVEHAGRTAHLLYTSWNVARKKLLLHWWAPIISSFEFTVWWVVFVTLHVGVIDVSHFSSTLSTHPLVSNLCSTWFELETQRKQAPPSTRVCPVISTGDAISTSARRFRLGAFHTCGRSAFLLVHRCRMLILS